MRDAFGNERSLSEIKDWRIPGIWWIQNGDALELSESRHIPGFSSLDDRYWARLAKIAQDWRAESRVREIGDLIAASHLQLGLSQERNKTKLETLLKKSFHIIKRICDVPETEIRLDDLKLPIDRSRRMAKGALAHLASHSEDWLRVTTRGPIPKQIISSIRVEDITIYENRLVRTLIDRSISHLGLLIDAIRKDQEEKFNLEGAIEQHRKRGRITGSLGADSKTESLSEIKDRREQIEEIRDSLLALRQSILGIATNGSQGVTELHITNLLANEQRYREMVPLWEALRVYEGSEEQSTVSLLDIWLNRQADMRSYVELLISRSLIFIGAKEVGLDEWKLAGIDIAVEDVNNSWSISFSRKLYRSESIQIGILGCSIGAQFEKNEEKELLENFLALLSEKDGVGRKRKILLHLTYPNDVMEFAQELVLADPFESQNGDKTWFVEGGVLPLAVHPLALDSAERLGRTLSELIRRYWAETQDLVIELSDDFQNIPADDFDMAGSGFELSGRVLKAANLNFKSPTVAKSSKTFSKKVVDYRLLNASLKRLVDDLAAHKEEMFACPLRPNVHKASNQVVMFWNESGYELMCSECEIRWGVRICGNCGAKNPTLNTATEQDWENFELDEKLTQQKYFGLELWANLCEKSNDVFVCSSCAECQRASTENSCSRCSRRELLGKSRNI